MVSLDNIDDPPRVIRCTSNVAASARYHGIQLFWKVTLATKLVPIDDLPTQDQLQSALVIHSSATKRSFRYYQTLTSTSLLAHRIGDINDRTVFEFQSSQPWMSVEKLKNSRRWRRRMNSQRRQ